MNGAVVTGGAVHGRAQPSRAAHGVVLSVVTPSAGRAALVLRKLEALAGQTADVTALEVVLVDNACPEHVGDQVEARAWPFGLVVLRSPRRLPAAEARAWAAEAAQGRWLWWSDDDAVPRADAAARHLDAQACRPGVTIGSVRFVVPAGAATRGAEPRRGRVGGRRGDAHVDRPRERRWVARRVGPAQLTGVNTVLPRERFLAVAARLPRLPRPYGGEDALVGFALQAAGERFTAVPEAWVDHLGPLPARERGDPDAAYDAGFNASAIAATYPRAAWSLGVHPVALLAKRAALAVTAVVGPAPAPAWARFERAYAAGARDGRRRRPTPEVPT